MRVIQPNAITSATQLTATNVAEADYPAYSATTAYATGTRVMIASGSTHRNYEAVKVTATQVVTATVANPGVINWPAHGFVDGTPISFAISAGGTMWTGITAGVEYYVKGSTTDGFGVAATVGGAAINITGAGSGTVTATAKCNYGRDPTLAANRAGVTPFWRDVGATNRYKMFDASSSSQTENAETITVTVKAGRAAALALINIDANSAHVTVTSGGVVKYDKEIDLKVKNVSGLWSYFFAPIIRKTDAVLMDLPPYGDAEITVTLSKPGGVARCGGLVVGMPRTLGEMLDEPEIRILDYSRKTTDSYGETTLTKGKNAKRVSCQLFVENELIDETRRLLSTYTGTALVWVGDERFSSTILFGFYQDLRAVIRTGGSFCNLDIEGLT